MRPPLDREANPGEDRYTLLERITNTTIPLRLFMGVLPALFLLFQFAFLLADIDFLVSRFLIDDTYYYLQTAWNLTRSGFVSFDGIHPTNGVQLLWFWMVSLIGVVAPGKETFLRLVLAFCFLLNTAVLAPIWGVAHSIGRASLAAYMGAFWFLIVVTNYHYWTGMENSLHAFIFWCVVWGFLRFLAKVRAGERPRLSGVTMLLVLNVWVRLDSVVFSTLVFIACLAALYRTSGGARSFVTEHGRQVFLSISLATLGSAFQFAVFWLMGGSLLPVSALVKSAGSDWSALIERWQRLRLFLAWGAPAVEAYLEPIYVFLAAAMLVACIALFRRSPRRAFEPAILIAATTVLLFQALAVRRIEIVLPLGAAAALYLGRSPKREDVSFAVAWWTLLAAALTYNAVYAFGGIAYDSYFTWYRAPLHVFWVLTGALLMLALRRICRPRVAGESWRLSFAGACVILLAAAAGGYAQGFTYHAMLHARYRAAQELAVKTPPDALLAAWNAGAVGYFSSRRVINLDGLVNTSDYFREVLKGGRPLEEYLADNGVEYVIDYCCVRETGLVDSLRLVQIFPTREDWKPIILWRLQPASLSGDVARSDQRAVRAEVWRP